VTTAGSLRRGLVAGLLAGILAAVFAFVFAEPTIDRAIAFEEQRAAATAPAATHDHADEPVVSRDTQRRVGAPAGFALVGGAFGAVFGLLYAGLRRFTPQRDHWQRVLALGAAAVIGLYLVPFFRYPANPPGVGDPDTVGERTRYYLAAVLLGLVAVAAAWRLVRELARRGLSQPVRHVATAGVFVLLVAAGYAALPDNTDPVTVPAALLWDFRVLSLATQLLLWGALAAAFGLLTERAARQAP
jgi:predicted cobalt transporter CbtA